MQADQTVNITTNILEKSVLLSPDYLRLGRKRKSDQLKVPPMAQPQQQEQQQQQQQPPTQQQQQLQPQQPSGSVDLDSSQVCAYLYRILALDPFLRKAQMHMSRRL